jgi:hypothetical protein
MTTLEARRSRIAEIARKRRQFQVFLNNGPTMGADYIPTRDELESFVVEDRLDTLRQVRSGVPYDGLGVYVDPYRWVRPISPRRALRPKTARHTTPIPVFVGGAGRRTPVFVGAAAGLPFGVWVYCESLAVWHLAVGRRGFFFWNVVNSRKEIRS